MVGEEEGWFVSLLVRSELKSDTTENCKADFSFSGGIFKKLRTFKNIRSGKVSSEVQIHAQNTHKMLVISIER